MLSLGVIHPYENKQVKTGSSTVALLKSIFILSSVGHLTVWRLFFSSSMGRVVQCQSNSMWFGAHRADAAR
jgi:hypothetical protein